jgi:hypothetical protein
MVKRIDARCDSLITCTIMFVYSCLVAKSSIVRRTFCEAAYTSLVLYPKFS